MAEHAHKQCVPFITFLARFYFLGPLENIKRIFHDTSGERGHMPYVLVQQELNTNTFGAIWCLDSEVSYSETQDVNSCKTNTIQVGNKQINSGKRNENSPV